VKYHKNIQLFLLFSLGWQPGYNRAGTCQWHVPGYEWNGEHYTF
jgi:hypothetical protein